MTVPTSHPYDFDPTCGMDLDALFAVAPPPAPAGFDDFWAERHRAARAVDPAPRLRRSALAHDDWHVLDVVFASTGGFAIGGWLLLPKKGRVRRGLVVGHGYGGRTAPDFDLAAPENAVLFPCFRGLSLSARPPISPDPDWHVLHDIDKPGRYIVGGCVEDLWTAVSALLALYPWLEGRIGYSGISFGGGIGALAIAHDRRIDRGQLSLPTFGHQPLRLKLPSVGSARAVQGYAKKHEDVIETLKFYDAATAAGAITVPMLVAVARFDPAVAPPCQFAVANALSENCKQTVILDAGHVDYPGASEQKRLLADRTRRFFSPS